MDTLLEQLIKCDHHFKIKKALIEKCIIGAANKPEIQIESNVKAMFYVSWKLAVTEEDILLQEICAKVFQVWATNNMTILAVWMESPEFLEYLSSQNIKDIARHLDLATFCYRNVSSPNASSALSEHLIRIMLKDPQTDCLIHVGQLVQAVGSFLPRSFLLELIQRLLAMLVVNQRNITHLDDKLIEKINHLCYLYKHIWNLSDETIQATLETVYCFLSKCEPFFTLPLAAVINVIPPVKSEAIFSQMVNSITDGKVLILVINNILGWLVWPGLNHTKSWILTFLKSLINSDKYIIVMNIFDRSVDQMIDCLFKPSTIEAASEVLAFLLLSCQRSPLSFHKFAVRVPALLEHIETVSDENSSHESLQVMSDLVYTLIHHHSGFPDIYDPVLIALEQRKFKKPSTENMEKCLEAFQFKAKRMSSMSYSLEATNSSNNEDFYSVKLEGLTGLANNGNTCYINSILSALYMTESFRLDVLETFSTAGEPIFEKLQEVFGYLLLSERLYYNAKDFVFASRPPWFEAGTQQDCFEFLHYLLIRIHEEETKEKTIFPNSCEFNFEESLTSQNNDTSKVHQCFGGVSVTSYLCHKCGQCSNHQDNFTELQLPLPDSEIFSRPIENVEGHSTTTTIVVDNSSQTDCCESVETLIRNVFKPELLKDENKYRCDRCQDLCNAERLFRVSCPPNNLILTLLRFTYNSKEQKQRKLFQKIDLQRLIYLPLTVDDGGSGGVGQTEVPYCLYAVIMHSGGSTESGHYFTYARSSVDFVENVTTLNGATLDALENKWFLFNDERISTSSFESFEHITDRFARDVPYVLFYTRVLEGDLTSNAELLRNRSNICVTPRVKALVELDNQVYLKEKAKASSKGIKRFSWNDNEDDSSPGGSGCGIGSDGIGGSYSARFVF